MEKFIEVNMIEGNKSLVNIKSIDCVGTNEVGTLVIMLSNTEGIVVTESYEEIKAMLIS